MVTFGAGDVDGISWYLTVNSKYFRDIHILPDAECEISSCPTPFEAAEIDDERVEDLRDLIASELSETLEGEAETARDPGITLDIPDRPTRIPDANLPTSGECCVSNVYTGINGINVPFEGAARWVDVASGPHDADPAWYMTTDGF